MSIKVISNIIGLFVVFAFVFISLSFPLKVYAGCIGTMQCQYYGNCTWSISGDDCTLGQQGNDGGPFQGICECELLDGPSYSCGACAATVGCSGSCITGWQNSVSGGTNCTVLTGSCTPVASCGNGACEAGEDCSSCPADCTSGCTSCPNNSCDAGENSCTCPQDCSGTCDTSSCTGDAGCNAIANCGVNGWDPASGSCPAGQVCCKSKDSTWTPNCSWNISQLDYPECRYGEGNYCKCMDLYGIGCSGCADGLSGGGCFCPACVPQCTPACGQGDQCSGTCPNTDGGIPNCPALDSVTPYLNTGTGQVTVSWSGSSKAELYNVVVYPRGSTAACPPTNPDAYCSSNQSGTSFSFYPNSSLGNEYTIKITPINTTCGYEVSSGCNTDFTIYAPISVEFHQDNTGACNTSDPVVPGSGPAGVLNTTDGASFNNNQTIAATTATVYAPYNPSLGTYSVTLDPGLHPSSGIDWQCLCPGTCQFNGVNSPDGPLKFYLSEYDLTNTGWFQTLGGNLFSAETAPNTAITDPIPVDTCDADANCQSDMILKDADDRDNSAGYTLTAGGLVDSSNEDGNQTGYITQRNEQTHAAGNTLDRVVEDYDFFAKAYKLGTNPTDNSSDFVSTNNAQKPTVARDYYYVPGNLNIQEPWTVASGESYVIFVDGNLLINDDADYLSMIDVQEGGFLAFIVSGHINIAETVGNNNDLDTLASNLEGVFIADGHISIGSKGEAGGGDERFVGEGIFVGWGGVVLARDFSDGGIRKAENNTRPVDLFVFRPDLVVNAPEAMAQPRLLWQESN